MTLCKTRTEAEPNAPSAEQYVIVQAAHEDLQEGKQSVGQLLVGQTTAAPRRRTEGNMRNDTSEQLGVM